MGYYTKFDLETSDGKVEDHKEAITKTTNYFDLWSDEIKWYDCEKDMKEYSKLHPDVVFTVSGEGNEMPDLWKAYFANGKMQKTKAIISYHSFDPTLLR